jgi:molybdopterin-guanine dinucleotide biosynthesis protein A
MEKQTTTGGVVLCGGVSSRMGRPKAWLPFGSELMLPRIVRIVSEAVSPIVVVAAQRQTLPDLPADVEIVHDEHAGCGPLAGLAVGLTALNRKCDAAYVSSCDVPFLSPGFVRGVVELLGGCDIAIPRDDDYHYPLAATYRVSLAKPARELIAAGQHRLLNLIDSARTRFIDVAELREFDPDLRSLRNINSPEDYAAALRDGS